MTPAHPNIIFTLTDDPAEQDNLWERHQDKVGQRVAVLERAREAP